MKRTFRRKGLAALMLLLLMTALLYTAAATGATGIELNRTEAELTVYPDGRETLQLIATVTPAGADRSGLYWCTGNPAVATVDSEGLVTARGAGTTKIEYRAVDGDLSAACTVTVRVSAECKNHTWDEGIVTLPAACTKDGIRKWTCLVCGAERTEAIPQTGHTPAEDAAVEPTCTEPGKTRGSHCAVCGEVLEKQEPVPASGHQPVTDPALAPKCESSGLTEGSHCARCFTVFEEQRVIPPLGHTEVEDPEVEPTCTKPGKTEGSHCSVCGEVIREQKPIPAEGHRLITDPAEEPTCTRAGHTLGTHCFICDKVIKKQKVIPALGHQWLNPTFDWKADMSSCRAAFACDRCEKIKKLQAKITASEKKTYILYTAKATLGGKTYKTTRKIYTQAEKSGGIYRLSGSTAVLTGVADKNAQAFTVAASVKANGKTYKVTEIAPGACKGMKKLKTLSISADVAKIGKDAFRGCSALAILTLRTEKLKSGTVGAGAFAGLPKKVTVRVPEARLKAYRSLLKKKGLAKTAVFRTF